MSTYYQLIFLDDTACDACQKIRKRFFEMLDECDVDASIVAVLYADDVMTSGYQSSKPTFAFYFGGEVIDYIDLVPSQKLMANADAVYPVYFTPGNFDNTCFGHNGGNRRLKYEG